MPAHLDVCIRGSGIVGRTIALLLARERLRVGLVESPRSEAFQDVRAYALDAASRDLLESIRAWPDAAHATPVSGMDIHGDDGGQVQFQPQDGQALAWIVDVPALETRLAEAARYQPLITSLTEPQKAALTVVCEGRASRTRAEFGVGYDLHPYGQHAVAARLRCERPHGNIARQWFFGGDILALLPLGSGSATDAGHSVALVWSVSQERSQGLLDASPEDFQVRLEAACHHVLGMMVLESRRGAWPLVLARADRWSGPGWVLAGDAAHAVHPLAGQGLNLGLADARVLAKVLHEREYWRDPGDLKLLRRYERARKVDVLARGSVSDALQKLFALDHPALGAVRNWGMRRFDGSGPVKQWVVRQAAGRL